MSDSIIKELDTEILAVTKNLESLNDSLKCDFEEYILKKCLIKDNKCISEESADFINSFSLSEQDDSIKQSICVLNSDMKLLFDKLETSVDTYLFVQKILSLDQCLQSVRQYIENDFYNAAEQLVLAKRVIDECSRSGRLLDFYKQKNEDYYKLFTSLSFESLEKWNSLVCFKVTDHDNKDKSSSMFVSTNYTLLKSVYQTLELLKVTYKEIFCDNLLTEILKPIILYNCKIRVEKANGFSSLSLDYSIKSTDLTFVDTIESLVKVFEFLNNFFDLRFDHLNPFILSVGSLAADNFLKLFVDKHVFKKVPLKRINVDEYSKTIDEMSKLFTFMADKGFIQENNVLVNEYCSSAENVFELKVGLRYKQECTSLLKLDLQNMLILESKSLTSPMPDLSSEVLPAEEADLDFWSTFITLLNNDSRKRSFLQCQVSKSISKLVDLIQDCLSEASLSDSLLKHSLHNTILEIIVEYLKLPDIHRKLIEIIPQQSILVFTNTWFLIMKLVHFSKEFNLEHLFDDYFSQLQKMAIMELYKQVRSQEAIVISSLNKSGLQDLSKLEVFPKFVEKVIRQCLRQAMLLKTVWMDVLSQDLYCLVIGRFINTFIQEIIQLILSASDIREDIANNLVELFTLISDKAPQVFPESREVHRYVKNWLKLRELGLVLAGSLADINERWAGGSGPLAHELEAFQVRALIIALFQSSDIRQRTLASIR